MKVRQLRKKQQAKQYIGSRPVYSSAKIALDMWAKSIEEGRRLFEDKFVTPMYNEFLEKYGFNKS